MSIELIKKSTDDFMTYAAAVIKSRAIPNVEDQLKPVHRRILHTLATKKLWSTAKYMKVANVVGATMVYHPHGDASINDALVRLSQEWKMRYPLVLIHGNNGSVGGDPAAAGRYIECKLSPIGDALLENTIEGIVPFVDNYDNTEREPTILGGLFPNILCNGTEGIAVGMSCGLVPHNLNEVVDLLIASAEGKVANVEQALQYLQGPDFPLGGIIVDGYKLPEIYKSGQGSITLRAKAEIKGNRITFSEFPYNVDVETHIIKAIKKMKVEENYDDIDEIENHLGKNSCFIVVVLRKNANPQKVLKDLYENTPLEKTVKINQTVIHNGIPVQLSLNGLCSYYLRHQHTIYTNKAKMTLEKASHTKKINEGYHTAVLNIDETIRIIRSSSSKEEASSLLMSFLEIDAEQAKAILSLQLGRLTKMDVNEILQKIKVASDTIKEQNKIITNASYRVSLICKDLLALKEKFGDNRRTQVNIELPKTEEKLNNFEGYTFLLDDESLVSLPYNGIEDAFKRGGNLSKYKVKYAIDNKNCEVRILNTDGTLAECSIGISSNLFRIDKSKEAVVTVSRKGIMKKTPMAMYKKFDRLCRVKEGDEIVAAFCCNNSDAIAVLQDSGKVVGIPVKELKDASKLTIGTKQADGAQQSCVTGPLMYTLNASGQVKRFKGEEIGSTSSALNDECIGFGTCDEHNFYYAGKMVPIKWSEIAIKSKTSNGAKLTTKKLEFII